MLCPNCDGMINAIGCQSCGWKRGDPFPAYRLEQGSTFPLRRGDNLYPPMTGGTVNIPVVRNPPPVQTVTVHPSKLAEPSDITPSEVEAQMPQKSPDPDLEKRLVMEFNPSKTIQ